MTGGGWAKARVETGSAGTTASNVHVYTETRKSERKSAVLAVLAANAS